MRDAQGDPNERPLRVQREGTPLDLADKLTQLKRKQAAQAPPPTKRQERPQPLAASSPGAGPSSVTSKQFTSSSTITPQPSNDLQRRRAHSPSPPDVFDRGLPRSSNPGRLFNPDAADGSAPAAATNSRQAIVPNRSLPREQQFESMSDASSAGSPRRPLPARGANAAARRGAPSGAASSIHQQQQQQPRNPQTAQRHPPADSGRRLFEPSRDDPLRFAATMSPSTRQSATPSIATTNTGYLSASSTSDSRSLASSAFTLSSATSGTSVESGPFQQGGGRKSEPANVTPLVAELKRVYREISEMEKRLKASYAVADSIDEEPSRFQTATTAPTVSAAQDQKWIQRVEAHKALVELNYRLLEIATGPSIPASVQSIPDRYNIPLRLWSFGFHQLIVTLRRASATSPNALDILTDFIYYAYKFYTELFEEHNLQAYRGMWLEALGDLASYRMMVAAHEQQNRVVATVVSTPTPGNTLATTAAISALTQQTAGAGPDATPSAQANVIPTGNNSPIPSVGIRAAAEMGESDERETWRATAREWYAMGLKDTPGAGRLQHHLGTLSRDVKGEELRAVYHFTKSLIAIHPFDAAREATLNFFSPQVQQTLAAPTASATSLFLHIQGQLFTRIDLDQVQPNLARFIERLELDEPSGEEPEWIMMAVLAIGSLLEFGKADSTLRRACGLDTGAGAGASSSSQAAGGSSIRSEPSRPTSWSTDGGASIAAASSARAQPWVADQAATAADQRMDADAPAKMDEDRDDDPSNLSRPMQALTTNASTSNLPPAMDSPRAKQAQLVFNLAMEVAFTTLGYLIKTKPYMPAQNPYVKPPLNPYITVLLTFIATIFKYPAALPLMERSIPWGALADLLGTALRRSGGPRETSSSSSAPSAAGGGAKDAALFSASQLLPEDWSLRGMEWTNRRVYERGFWLKAHKGPLGSLVQGEMDVVVSSNAIMSPTFAGGAGSNTPASVTGDGLDGIVEDDDDDDDAADDANSMDVDDRHSHRRSRGGARLSPAQALGVVRWKRLRSSAEMLVRTVPGFRWDANSLSIVIVEGLADKIALWEQERLDAEEERATAQARQQQLLAQTRHRRANSNEMDVDGDYEVSAVDEEDGEDVQEDDDDDFDDSDQVRELKARRKYLRSLVRMSQRTSPRAAPPLPLIPSRRGPKPPAPTRPMLKVLPGYTVLVVDTNILLSSLSVVTSLVDSNRWTIIVPLAVITELDGISKNASPLGNAAVDAMSYLIAAVPSHNTLKVQTSKGNYLRTLSVRSENIDFSHGSNHDRNMDDLILRSATWQAEHFFDHRLLGPDGVNPVSQPDMGTSKVVVLSFDRNLRLKARSRKLDAADEKDMGGILAVTTA